MNEYLYTILASLLLSAISCGLAGAYLIMRRLVHIGGGVSHASFAGVGLGVFLNINPILTALAVAVSSALGIEYVSRKEAGRVDSLLIILWSLGMALGALFLFLSKGYQSSMEGYLFGNVLTVNKIDLYMLLGVCILLVLFFIFFLRPIQFHAFDSGYLRATRKERSWINYTAMVLLASVMILNVKMVGIILLMAMLTIPQMIAFMYNVRFTAILIYSVLISILCTGCGLCAAWYLDIPSGVAIVLTQVGFLILAALIKTIRKI